MKKSDNNSRKIVNSLKSALYIYTDTELATYLGVNQSTIANWILRDTVNYKLIFDKCGHLDLGFITDNVPKNAKKSTYIKEGVVMIAQEPEEENDPKIVIDTLRRQLRQQEMLITYLEKELTDLKTELGATEKRKSG